ncbi:hypothetical protein RI367_007745 [Sorochytrium milnesiophthora]
MFTHAAMQLTKHRDGSATCADALSSQFIQPDGTGTEAGPCSCLSTCTQTSTCCDDVAAFSANFQSWVSVHPGQVPLDTTVVNALNKTEPSIVLHRPYTGADGSQLALIAYRQCSFNRTADQLPWLPKSCDGAYEVVAYELATGQFADFEAVVSVVQPVQAGFGHQATYDPTDPEPDRLFYAELYGVDAVNVAKTALTGLKMCGFRAVLPEQPSGKLAFDPTPGRTWGPIGANYQLAPRISAADAIEASTEIHDMNAAELDDNYQGMAKSAGYQAVPWKACFLREVIRNNVYQEMLGTDGATYVALQSF